MSQHNRGKGRSNVIINNMKRNESGPTFGLKTYNRFDVLNSDDDEQDIKNSCDGMLCSELATLISEITEVGDPQTNIKVLLYYIIDYNC